jgi:hypothetical protein
MQGKQDEPIIYIPKRKQTRLDKVAVLGILLAGTSLLLLWFGIWARDLLSEWNICNGAFLVWVLILPTAYVLALVASTTAYKSARPARIRKKTLLTFVIIAINLLTVCGVILSLSRTGADW